MGFDAKTPYPLKNLQQWFASIITRPIDDDNRMNPISPQGQPMEKEAANYIVPSPTLNPDQRIELYNQQYWWRILNTLQEAYPLLLRLFGYHAFNNSIAFPYVMSYPSIHWSLNYIGERLPRWIEESYHAEDKRLVLHAAQIDCAYTQSFLAAQKPSLSLENLTEIDEASGVSSQKLTLQPHVHDFKLPYDLFQFRMEMLNQDPDYWLENDFPALEHLPEGQFLHFILFRTRRNQISFETLESSEAQLLTRLAQGATLDELCDWLGQHDPTSQLVMDASQKLHLWFQRWSAYQWLCLADVPH